MAFAGTTIWKEAPFIRLLIPFSAGIVVQSIFRWPLSIGYSGVFISLLLLLFFSFTDISRQFSRYWMFGVFLNSWIFFSAILVNSISDRTDDPRSILKGYNDSSIVVATLIEPLSEKPKSYKAVALIGMLQENNLVSKLEGKIIIYFRKDDLAPNLGYGSKISFRKKLQPIKNTGNPGGFDYKRYCALQQIYSQVYLAGNEYQILPGVNKNIFKEFIFYSRKYIVGILRNCITGKKELGLAEALLIGYKDDLDSDLVQSYSNTGVVHVIAISGLHLGLIYWLLKHLLTVTIRLKKIKWLTPVLVISGLWMFSLLAGGSPSVLRSAVMFTMIVLGENISRRTSIFNSLAASAFLLLCYNPSWLWDVGFQLSYAAVLSIVIFMKPIYNAIFFQNKILDSVWKLNAVTLSAQVLTVPLCLFYFHQFPNFFLISNLVVVPLSSMILLIELILCIVFPITALAKLIGVILSLLIRYMNLFIELVDSLPYAVTSNIKISLGQVFCMYAIIVFTYIWISNKTPKALHGVLAGLLMFGSFRFIQIVLVSSQQMFIIYNIPNHQAIEFITGYNYIFKGDSIFLENSFVRRFHLDPSRTLHHLKAGNSSNMKISDEVFFHFGKMNILVIERRFPKFSAGHKIMLDYIVLSRNPQVSISEINEFFICREIVFDASNSPQKVAKWKSECARLGIPYFSVPDKGAFVMNLN